MPRISATWTWMVCLSASVLALQGCGSSPTRKEEVSPSVLRGSREASRSRKASATRPHPWEQEQGPFEADRFDLEPFAARRRAHQEEHSGQVLVMESFSHPACAEVPDAQRRRCPLLAVRWTRTVPVPGGIALETAAPGQDAEALHRWVRCHIAFGKVRPGGCPLHLPGVHATTRQRGKVLALRIVTEDASQVEALRGRIRELVR